MGGWMERLVVGITPWLWALAAAVAAGVAAVAARCCWCWCCSLSLALSLVDRQTAGRQTNGQIDRQTGRQGGRPSTSKHVAMDYRMVWMDERPTHTQTSTRTTEPYVIINLIRIQTMSAHFTLCIQNCPKQYVPGPRAGRGRPEQHSRSDESK
uniref:Secreted protein n=1 Tax=Vitrella brassicaformis TaxID=1169539 RepID=A0A7S1P4W2_9ALVE